MGDTVFEKLEAWGCAVAQARERLLQNDELYLDFLNQITEEDDYDKLKAALEEGRIQEAFDISHTQKGVISNLGITPLYDALCALVEKLRSGEHADTKVEYEAVIAQFNKLKEILGK